MSTSTVVADTPTPRTVPKWSLWKALSALASLKLTVTLMGLSFFLVFAGTLAQVEQGIWQVVREYFRSFVVFVPFQIFVVLGQKFLGLPTTWNVPFGFYFPGGWTLGFLLLLNLVAAHAVRFKFKLRRGGIMILHAGVILLLIGELLTGLFAVEAHMSIVEGRSANYAEDSRHAEFALVNRSDPKKDAVTVMPATRLKPGTTIKDPALPIEIEVLSYFNNSFIPDEMPAHARNPATEGLGAKSLAIERPVVSGTDADQKVDAASAYLKLRDSATGGDLGTYLVSLWFTEGQPLTVNGKQYEISLRHKRLYKPYAVELVEFRHDKYLGTDVAKNFSSQIRLTDPTRNENRDVTISMNAPMRYHGETFFQSGVLPGGKGTVLQVVDNPAWTLPYISCVLVTLGMTLHFGQNLLGFLQRAKK